MLYQLSYNSGEALHYKGERPRKESSGANARNAAGHSDYHPSQMNAPLRIALLLAAGLALAAPAHARWQLLRQDKAAALYVDTASVKRHGEEVRFRYLADYAAPQEAFRSGAPYRSMVTDAMLRCKTRQIALGRMQMYAAPGGKGRLVEATPLGPAPFEIVENATSDEDLWKHFCAPKR